MRAHVFVDAENINPVVFARAYAKLKNTYDICGLDIYGKSCNIPDMYNKYIKANFNYAVAGKNNADIMLACDMINCLNEEPLTSIYVIMSQDCDYSYAIKIITNNKKNVVIVTEKNAFMRNLKEVGADINNISQLQVDIDTGKIELSDVIIYKNKKSSCFLKINNKIFDIPFTSGISLNEMGLVLKTHGIKPKKNKKLTGICEDSLLKVENNRVYFYKEEEYEWCNKNCKRNS